jgi:hypothetical protein
MIDHYSILGLDRDCTRDEIKNAYHRLAKQYHPDINKSPGAPEKFRQISESYEYLIKVRDGEQPDVPGYPGSYGGAGRAAADGGGRPYGLRPIEEIIASLKSGDRDVVRAAVDALGSRRFYDNSGVLAILTGYLGSPDVALRRSAVTALGRLGNLAAVGDLAKMLRDRETQVRFDAVVALGNLGAPVALTYLEMMDQDDPLNSGLVMNARKETIYGIKKKNRMYPPSRMCPFCGGYDIVNRAEPFKCHECGRAFGFTGQRPDSERGQYARAFNAAGKSGAIDDCAFCRGNGPLATCEYCGQSFCASHLSPAAHHCWQRDNRSAVETGNYAGQGIFRSRTFRNLAALAILLIMLLLIGVIVVAINR